MTYCATASQFQRGPPPKRNARAIRALCQPGNIPAGRRENGIPAYALSATWSIKAAVSSARMSAREHRTVISRSIKQILMASLGSTAILSSVLVSATVAAATVAVSSGNSLYLTVTSSGNNNSVNAGTGTISGLSGGGYTYVNGFGTPQTTNFGSTSYGFYDDYVISIGAGQVDSISSTITLGNLSGITGFSVRLYNYAANGNVAPLTGTPATNSVIDAWSTTIPLGGNSATYSVLAPQTLTAGTYVVEVRGTASGIAGGTYSGNLNLTPVPLPAALPLLLSGVGLIGGFGRRRRASATA
jgi:hypothetical protein